MPCQCGLDCLCAPLSAPVYQLCSLCSHLNCTCFEFVSGAERRDASRDPLEAFAEGWETFEVEKSTLPNSGGRVRVLDYMSDGKWRTLEDIAIYTSLSEATVSARLRDLRKSEFGGWLVEKRLRDKGLYEYAVYGLLAHGGRDDEY